MGAYEFVEAAMSEVLTGQGVTLDANQELTVTAKVRVPSGAMGEYFWRVAANSGGEVFEGLNAANNLQLSPAAVFLSLPELTLGGQAVTGQFQRSGESVLYRLGPLEKKDIALVLRLAPAAGNAKLFVRRGIPPIAEMFDARSGLEGSPLESVSLSATPGETYYVLAEAATLSQTPAAFSLAAAEANFNVVAVSPASGGSGGTVRLPCPASNRRLWSRLGR